MSLDIQKLDFTTLHAYEELSQTKLTVSEKESLLNTKDFLSAENFEYQESLVQSNLIDQILGFKVEHIEKKMLTVAKSRTRKSGHEYWSRVLHGHCQTWVGLNPCQLQTPYHELVELLNFLEMPDSTHILDLGAAYGRMGVVAHALAPALRFTGLEYVSERVEDGNRVFQELSLKDSKLFKSDISSDEFKLPRAHVYFIYDYGRVEHIKKTLLDLEEKLGKDSFILVARGRGVCSLVNYNAPWLVEVEGLDEKSPYRIFSTNGSLDIY